MCLLSSVRVKLEEFGYPVGNGHDVIVSIFLILDEPEELVSSCFEGFTGHDSVGV